VKKIPLQRLLIQHLNILEVGKNPPRPRKVTRNAGRAYPRVRCISSASTGPRRWSTGAPARRRVLRPRPARTRPRPPRHPRPAGADATPRRGGGAPQRCRIGVVYGPRVPVGEQPAAARTTEEVGLILSIAGLMQTARFHPCGRLLLPVALSGCRPPATASEWPAGRARQQRPPLRACSPSSTRPRGWLPPAGEGWGWQKVQGGADDGEETYDFVGKKNYRQLNSV